MNDGVCTGVHRPDYSIVVPVYYNEGSLRELVASIRNDIFAKTGGRRGEIVFVDDGSGDGSYHVLCELQCEHPTCIRVVKLSRNFGQVNAIWCGLSLAPAAAVVMSADGQDDPRHALTMLQRHFDGDAEIVIATRESRDESAYRRGTSRLFYWLMRKLSFPEMPLGGFDFFVLGSKARRALLGQFQHHGFLQGQVLGLGFRKRFIQYRRLARRHGTSRWSFARKMTYLLDGMLGYSFVPIRFMSLLGALCSVLGFAYACVVLVVRLVHDTPVRGWAPLMMAILLIGGMQMLMLGVIGEYLWRVFAQVRGAPPYIVEEIIDETGGDAHCREGTAS
jgi:dolichol-phosphate mannosyltransferase